MFIFQDFRCFICHLQVVSHGTIAYMFLPRFPFFLFLFYNFHAENMNKHISNSVCSVQYPNTGQNIQHKSLMSRHNFSVRSYKGALCSLWIGQTWFGYSDKQVRTRDGPIFGNCLQTKLWRMGVPIQDLSLRRNTNLCNLSRRVDKAKK